PGDGAVRFTGSLPIQKPRSVLGDRLCADAAAAVLAGETIDAHYEITTADRAVGTRLGCELASASDDGKVTGKVRAHFEGEAGQSFGAFLSDGIVLTLVG
ncbi:MAG: hypothetical protein QOH90_2400, partial [Actinomycetota bacterium]|nr:hypothetical protein [Actinomycetota bacterium]